ncbi:MAG TPA: ester cyclase [Dehalococcoidia bacterium]|nr:ester cyclase [Dehalococcoidia bacterium]
MATADTNKALVLNHYHEIDVQWNLDAADDQLSADFVDHAAPPGTPPGPAAVKRYLADLHAAVPDLQLSVDDLIAEGDKVVARNTWRGTHRGTLWGVPATNRSFAMEGVVVWRIADGKIAERWATIDRLGLFQQLGVLPGAVGVDS